MYPFEKINYSVSNFDKKNTSYSIGNFSLSRMNGIVRYFPNFANFILLFHKNLLHIDLWFIHRDIAYSNELVYIDGNVLYDNLLIKMMKLEKINFSIATGCLCDQQMNSIIKSFQTGK